MQFYEVDVALAKQEDGLWRAEVPGLQGCFVDASTVTQALQDLQAAAAMFIDLALAEGLNLPASVHLTARQKVAARLPILLGEHRMKRAPAAGRRRAPA